MINKSSRKYEISRGQGKLKYKLQLKRMQQTKYCECDEQEHPCQPTATELNTCINLMNCGASKHKTLKTQKLSK